MPARKTDGPRTTTITLTISEKAPDGRIISTRNIVPTASQWKSLCETGKFPGLERTGSEPSSGASSSKLKIDGEWNFQPMSVVPCGHEYCNASPDSTPKGLPWASGHLKFLPGHRPKDERSEYLKAKKRAFTSAQRKRKGEVNGLKRKKTGKVRQEQIDECWCADEDETSGPSSKSNEEKKEYRFFANLISAVGKLEEWEKEENEKIKKKRKERQARRKGGVKEQRAKETDADSKKQESKLDGGDPERTESDQGAREKTEEEDASETKKEEPSKTSVQSQVETISGEKEATATGAPKVGPSEGGGTETIKAEDPGAKDEDSWTEVQTSAQKSDKANEEEASSKEENQPSEPASKTETEEQKD